MVKKKTDIFVSTVLVVDSGSRKVAEKVKEIAGVLNNNYTNYEAIIIDNGIKPIERLNLNKLLTKVACIRVIQLSRSHDTDTAIFAGVDAAIGDYVCILYGEDPVEMIPDFVDEAHKSDIVFGVAANLLRGSRTEQVGAKLFYWYNKKFLKIDIPANSTYYLCMNRVAANALTRSGRYVRHIRHMAKQVGFEATNLTYMLPHKSRVYQPTRKSKFPILRAVDLISSYSKHPLRAVAYLGLIASFANIIYAIYVVIIHLSVKDVARGWTTLSLQSSLMFFLLFLITAVLAEYIGRILEESRGDAPYHINHELSSTISIADESRINVTK